MDQEGLVQALLKGHGEAATASNPPEMWAGVLPPAQVRAFYATLPSYPSIWPRPGPSFPCPAIRTGSRHHARITDDPYKINIIQTVAENLQQIGIR